MKINFVYLILGVILLFVTCNKNKVINTDILENNTSNNNIVGIDSVRQYTKEDLMEYFVCEVCEPIDSVCGNCFLSLISDDEGYDLSSDLFLIEDAIKFIKKKQDGLEKLVVYDIDENCKSKMIVYVVDYRVFFVSDCKLFVKNKHLYNSIIDNFRYQFKNQYNKEIHYHEMLYDEILIEYSFYHDRT